MASFEQKFYRHNPTLLTRLKRDIHFVWESLCFLILWATHGRKIRAAYREAKQQNTKIKLDELV